MGDGDADAGTLDFGEAVFVFERLALFGVEVLVFEGVLDADCEVGALDGLGWSHFPYFD